MLHTLGQYWWVCGTTTVALLVLGLWLQRRQLHFLFSTRECEIWKYAFAIAACNLGSILFGWLTAIGAVVCLMDYWKSLP